MEPLRIEPNREPTGTFVRPQVACRSAVAWRRRSRPSASSSRTARPTTPRSTTRTILFQAAQRLVEELTQAGTSGRRGPEAARGSHCNPARLFPQVVPRGRGVRPAGKVDFNGAPEPELGLEKYARQVVERVRDAIQPDDSSGEPPLLPLLNRTQEIGSTAGVEFRTKRPVFATMASHIGHVVADTAAWEQSAAFRLEQAAQQGLIRFYARNEGMDLSIPYEFLGVDHGYEPDFLVRMAMPEGEPDLTLVLEVKGFEDNQTTAKHEGARRWVRAVNNWGKLGRWAFHVCRNPQVLERELAHLLQQARGPVAA